MKKLTILMVVAAVVCFSVPAMAVDWNFYGSARVETWYDSRDFGDFLNAAGTDDKDAELDWTNESSQRIGAHIKADHIKAQVEFSIADQGVAARRLYGVWNFGAGTLKVGKDYTPVKQFISAQAAFEDLGLLGIGTAYGSRHAQLALGFGGFEIALINPSTPGVLGTTDGDVDTIIPKIEAVYGMGFDAFNFNVMGGYNYYSVADVTKDTGGTKDLSVTSWIVAGDAGFNFGPAYVKGAASYGSNVGDAGWNLGGSFSESDGVEANGLAAGQNISGLAVFNGDDIKDTVTYMGAIVVGLKMSDMITFEVGGGVRLDDPDENDLQKTTMYSVYGNATIALAPGVYIIPEISYFDWGKSSLDINDDDAGNQIVVGAKWQIDF